MATEAMVRRGHAEVVHPWLDRYMRRLEDFPRGTAAIGTGWREALGDPRGIADWTAYFGREVAGQPWRQVLAIWWPRTRCISPSWLMALRTGQRAGSRYPVPSVHRFPPPLTRAPAPWPSPRRRALRSRRFPGSPGSRAGPPIAKPAGRTAGLAGGTGSAPDAVSAEGTESWLADLVDAAAIRYRSYGRGNGVMLVHSATAPNAALRTLPALDRRLWSPSLAAASAASAALTAVYAPATPASPAALPGPPAGPRAAEDAFARAVEHGDEHVIKFADTAADVYARTGNGDALAAAARAASLIRR